MKTSEVPQDKGFSDGIPEISYAVDENGRYTLVQSRGWAPKTLANDQAWAVIDEEIAEQIRLIRAGKRSPLAYYMSKHLMNPGLLASYAGISRWRVKWHLRPGPFDRLSSDMLARYAEIFGISIDQLQNPPELMPSEPHENR